MMRKKWEKAAFSVILAAVLAVSGVSYTAMAHGTTSQTITKDMLKDLPDGDYKVNMDMQKEASEGAYNAYFLKDEIQTVSIDIDENNLNYLLQNAIEKPSVMTNSVTIGDQTIGYAGLKTKGNYTLKHTDSDSDDNDRYSFTINFGKYVKKKKYGVTQNFYGCSKISFNNFYFDKTMMKEYFAMKLMSEMGVPTPQYGLAKLYINGNYYGVYFMVEAMESTIVEQYQQVSSDKISDYLAKPENTRFIYDDSMDKFLKEDGTFDLSSVLTLNEKGDYEASGALQEQSKLWEEDNDTLQDVAEMLPTVFSWERKLNFLSNGKDFSGNDMDVNSEEYLKLLDTVMDTDEVVRYFAVHSFLVQLDDMFSNEQNFGLYVDKDGKSMILPWDYDLCFGCYTPGRAEETANYALDCMYRFQDLDRVFEWDPDIMDEEWWEGEDWEINMEKEFYAGFPLFNVIYQNASLMEKYHSYMRDCSKIVTLGGTTSTGKTYTPAWFSSYIDTFTSKLEAAASEELASNVQYLNGAKQPECLLKGLPNLSKIMALRSVSVFLQTEGAETTVSGYGCDLYTLGNAQTGDPNNGGYRTIVDDKTGIFAATFYGDYNFDKPAASLTVKKLAKTNKIYQAAKSVIGCENDENLAVYKMTDTGLPEQKYVIGIPLDKAYAENEIAVYSYTEKETKKLNTVMSDNICTGKTGSIQYIAVVKTATETNLSNLPAEDDSVDKLPVVKKEKKITLNKTKLTLKVGKSYSLKLKNAEKKVTWSTSNKKIAIVTKNGKVTAKKKGNVVIKAVSAKKTYKCRVTVKNK